MTPSMWPGRFSYIPGNFQRSLILLEDSTALDPGKGAQQAAGRVGHPWRGQDKILIQGRCTCCSLILDRSRLVVAWAPVEFMTSRDTGQEKCLVKLLKLRKVNIQVFKGDFFSRTDHTKLVTGQQKCHCHSSIAESTPKCERNFGW